MTLVQLTALGFAALLSGCCTPPPPEVIRYPVEVKVPVPVPCIDKIPEHEAWALDDPAVAKMGHFDRGTTILKELEQRRAYEVELEATLRACVKPKPAP